MKDGLYTVIEAARFIGMSRSTVDKRIRKMKLKVTLVSNVKNRGRPLICLTDRDIDLIKNYTKDNKNAGYMDLDMLGNYLSLTTEDASKYAREAAVFASKITIEGVNRIRFSPLQVHRVKEYLTVNSKEIKQKRYDYSGKGNDITKNRSIGLYHRLTQYGGTYSSVAS